MFDTEVWVAIGGGLAISVVTTLLLSAVSALGRRADLKAARKNRGAQSDQPRAQH